MDGSHLNVILPRANCTPAGNTSAEQLLDILQNGYGSTLSANAFIASLGTYLGLSALIALLFCFLRPRNTVIYAPRAKYGDREHAPPPTKKSLLGWIPPLIATKEKEMVDKLGMDAAIFMRFVRMIRDIFIVLSVLGIGMLIPVYILAGHTDSLKDNGGSKNAWLQTLTPALMGRRQQYFWSVVVCLWLFNLVICAFVWWNYRKVIQLRQDYFNSSTYQKSLHARTLLITDIPKDLRSDDGIVQIVESVARTRDHPRAAIARNVKDLPDLMEEHEEAVRALEAVLAKYLKNPDKLPDKRPVCKASKKDSTYTKGQKVDAIEYWTARIKQLEIEIKQVRETLDKRNPLGYGFASYEQVTSAHQAAYAARKQGPQGTDIQLAPRPNDLIWKNLKMTKKERNWQTTINTVWVILLTVVWIAPNVFISVFLTNLQNLGSVWPAFNSSLHQNGTQQFWAVVQGVLSPAITTVIYLILPMIFRRLAVSSGNVTKTSRDRHVVAMLYSFFVLNNLVVVSLFTVIFTWVRTLIQESACTDAKDLILNSGLLTQLVNGLITTSPYWLTFQLRLNFGAAMDLAQLINLAWRSFSRRYMAPTPREVIELSAPQPFDYAGYLNLYLFHATVALSYCFIQPLILPVTVVYLGFDHWVKKYMLLYIFITKYESGGMFWRSAVNRIIFMTIFCNVVVALLVAAYTSSPWTTDLKTKQPNWIMLGLSLLPILIMLSFKMYCTRAFDDKLKYCSTSIGDAELNGGMDGKNRKHDRLGKRFGHPALYKPLMTPMVSSKSQHLLKQIYSGRTSVDETRMAGGYGDVYMDHMDNAQPGKTSAPAPFEIVNETELDFENFKKRADFQAQGGGDGALFGHAGDIVRPDTPSTMGGFKRTGTAATFESFDGQRSRSESRHGRNYSDDSETTKIGGEAGVEYPRGYHKTPNALREHSPAFSDYSTSGHPLQNVESREGLVGAAAAMGHSRLPSRSAQQSPYRHVAQTPGSTPGEETSYDYFRRGRQI